MAANGGDTQPSLRDPDLEYTRSFVNSYGRVCFVRTGICGGIQPVSKLRGCRNIPFVRVACREGVKNRYAIIKSAAKVRCFKLQSAPGPTLLISSSIDLMSDAW